MPGLRARTSIHRVGLPALRRCPARADVECGACIADPPHFDASRAAFVYAYPVDALIQALKYGGQLALAGLFARELYRRIGRCADVDLILPLPLHPARLAERGFNQAAEIAKVLSRLSGIAMDAATARGACATPRRRPRCPGASAQPTCAGPSPAMAIFPACALPWWTTS